jgi:hypothetical protein
MPHFIWVCMDYAKSAFDRYWRRSRSGLSLGPVLRSHTNSFCTASSSLLHQGFVVYMKTSLRIGSHAPLYSDHALVLIVAVCALRSIVST